MTRNPSSVLQLVGSDPTSVMLRDGIIASGIDPSRVVTGLPPVDVRGGAPVAGVFIGEKDAEPIPVRESVVPR